MRFLILHIARLPAAGMALFPFILVKRKAYKEDKVLINHEKIHLVQQLELLLIFFYIIYLVHYVINLARYRSHRMAYLNIVFEREAFHMDADLLYLKRRRLFAWRYFFG
ncbi:DNA phosphorothioation-dependent restriction protein DptG [Arcticibacter pallidicorallinus]|uniref:DNA phosphorothioation-dependent restriction protein DptG n=1 Tax=Arcticibacter pallidicorallinus TaxID=1259464 RepID=A0A2T0U773_9SPHI|nr:hypothetical protein [Arcticibacter pallidicorallinus]PRY53771.1 DNA phosphorothioation-dependent restriction protein DptG [Arcticibacter pallidicorallinus]